MSSSDKLAVGRADTLHEAGSAAVFFYCGGKGAGSCITPTTTTSQAIFIQLPSAIVYNKEITLQNIGIRFFNDAGPDGFGCLHSQGVTETPFYIALSSNGALTDAQVKAQGVQVSGAIPNEIKFQGIKMPQPTQATWQNGLWVQIVWGTIGLINVTGAPLTPSMIKIVKHNYDIRL